MPLTNHYQSAERAAQDIVARLGNRINLALPLGIGKANRLVNALYQIACNNPDIQLHIYTAITLQNPQPSNEFAKRFLDPISERFFAGYPTLEYASALRDNALPNNIKVTEFFFQPAAWLGNPQAQQSYASINYTHALDYLLDAEINLVLQLVAPGTSDDSYNLSGNPDITADLLKVRRDGRANFLLAGEINANLPVMCGDTECPSPEFALLLENKDTHYPLFTPPRNPATLTDHAIALRTAGLIKDGGTLQIGIGSISDAIAHALIMRHTKNDIFVDLQKALGVEKDQGHTAPFNEGLYGLSEMLVEGFIPLLTEGIIRRKVNGTLIHAGFFMGSPGVYRDLEALPKQLRESIAMMPVSFVNQLYGEEVQKRQERRHARFINCAIMATLTGAVVSDGLDNGQVISGVGGQYNFVEQAFALGVEARSIITLRATRTHKGKVSSNIVWQYGHTTIPRHLRDIIVTEYGVADLRGKSDADVIAEMLKVTDSRFQNELLKQAQKAGKIATNYTIPHAYRRNTPEQLTKALRAAVRAGHLPHFPLGSDFSQEEQKLAVALSELKKAAGSIQVLPLLWQGFTHQGGHRKELERMKLNKPRTWREAIMRIVILGALRKTRP